MAFVVFGNAEVQSQGSAERKTGTVAIVGGTVLLPDGESIEGATVLIRRGKIAAVGKDVRVPRGVKIIDAKDRIVAPGLIDASGALLRASSGAGGRASLNVTDALNPYDQHSLRAVASHGVTTVYVSPGLTGSFSGLGAILKVAPDATVEEMVLEDEAAVHATMTTGSSTRALNRLKSRLAVVAQFAAARKYREQWEDYEEKLEEYLEKLAKRDEKNEPAKKDKGGAGKNEKPNRAPKKSPKPESPPEPKKSASENSGAAWLNELVELSNKVSKSKQPQSRVVTEGDLEQPASAFQDRRPRGRPAPAGEGDKDKKKEEKLKKPKEPKKNPDLEVLLKVLDGRLPLRVYADRVEEILDALTLVEEGRVRLVLEGALEGHRVREEIAEAKVPVIVSPSVETTLSDPGVANTTDRANASLLSKEGVDISIGSAARSSLESRFVAWKAAVAVSGGLSRDKAFAAITDGAAKLLGISDRVGSLEVGKHGDVIIVDKHPLDTSGRVQTVVVEGQVVYSRGG